MPIVSSLVKMALATQHVSGDVVDLVAGIVTRATSNGNDAAAAAEFDRIKEEILLDLAAKASQYQDKRPPTESDVVQGLMKFSKCYREARNHKKRRVLFNAFYSSFQPGFYDEGLSEILWEKVEHLEYPDLRLLDEVIKETKPEERTAFHTESYGNFTRTRRGDQLEIPTSSEKAEFAQRLRSADLVDIEPSKTRGFVLVSWRGVAARLRDFALTEFWNEEGAQ